MKKLAEQVFVPGKSDHAVADVAGRQDAIFAAQAAGAATVIRDRDDGGEIRDRLCGTALSALGDMFLQAAQHGGKTSAASERNNPDGWPTAFNKFFHGKKGESAG